MRSLRPRVSEIGRPARYLALATLALLWSGCTFPLNRVAGSPLSDSEGILAGRITLLSDQPAHALLNFSTEPFFAYENDGFKVESGEQLIFRDMLSRTYRWSTMRTTVFPQDIEMAKTFPDFRVTRGCIRYLGDLTIDLRGGKVNLSTNPAPPSAVLDQLRQRYPAEFERTPMCPE